jgi:hypothetical protein
MRQRYAESAKVRRTDQHAAKSVGNRANEHGERMRYGVRDGGKKECRDETSALA